MSISTFFFFFFNDTATTEIYTLSLHDALPICPSLRIGSVLLKCHKRKKTRKTDLRWGESMKRPAFLARVLARVPDERGDRKSTRLNSSHSQISYAVFCLKKKIRRRHAGDRRLR